MQESGGGAESQANAGMNADFGASGGFGVGGEGGDNAAGSDGEIKDIRIYLFEILLQALLVLELAWAAALMVD
ncbi:unnamed protein product [Colias eurytheme]|nr:unnamed protein product [Colias eurytheme]